MRDVEAFEIFDGTTQIRQLLSGRDLQREGIPYFGREPMSQLIEVPIESLTPDSFAAFGEVIDELPDSARAEGGFKAARRVGFSIEGEVDLRVIRYEFKSMEFHLMERHLHVTETRVPLTPEPVVLVVAQSTSPGDRAALPNLESFRAFLLNGRQGVLLGTGAWHALDCFPVRSRHADFAFLSELATEKELRATPDLTECRRSLVVDLQKELDVRFAVVDPSGLVSRSKICTHENADAHQHRN